MSNAKIFLLGQDALHLRPMIESGYVTEADLQQLLARYVDLLPGDQIEPENPRRWLFVGREVGIPAAADEGGWWSLDHLFIDQDAIPTFVECKRSTDTRTRREVVAQMLDYAANGTEYWTSDRLRQVAAATVAVEGKSLDEVVGQFIGSEDGEAIEQFWTRMQDNLRAGRVRLIFVTDEAPKELRRMTEFLNGQMRDTEVLLVEIKQFMGEDGQRVLVPRVIGQTALTPAGAPSGPPVTKEAFIERISPELRPFVEQVLTEAAAHGHAVQWGRVGVSLRAFRSENGTYTTCVYLFPPNDFEFYFQGSELDRHDAAALRQELLGTGLLKESGERTLKALLKASDLPVAQQVWARMLTRMDEIREGRRE